MTIECARGELHGEVQHRAPQHGAHSIGLWWCEIVQNHHPLDHVADSGGERSISKTHGHYPANTARCAAHRTVDPDDPWRAAKPRHHETCSVHGVGEDACRRGKVSGGRRCHDWPSSQEGVTPSV